MGSGRTRAKSVNCPGGRFSRALALLCLAWCQLTISAANRAQLAKPYREFLSGPPSLLLTKDERSAFQHLGSDSERDSFIEHFWQVRNPTPGLPNNEFKEEFYRRVEYANAYYGKDAGTQGWHTDRGRTYILFGRPQTSMSYQGNQELYATELWFYSNPGLQELPAFFYVLFFEQNGAGGFRIYQPYVDTPDKLLREGGNSNAQAYQYLHGISAELANATLSWIPGEPIDTQNYTGSMASMQIVNAVEGYNSMPSYVSLIRNRSLRTENVTSKVHYKLVESGLVSFVALENGQPWVHWLMQINDPERMSWPNGKVNLAVNWKLYSQGRLVFEQSDTPSFDLPPGSAGGSGKRPLAYQDKTPVELGRYQLTVEMKNGDTGATYQASKEFEVKAPGDRTGIGDVLIVTNHRAETGPRPFAFAGVQFQVSPENVVISSHGLSILYQIYLPTAKPQHLTAHYAIGNIATNFKKTFEEKLDVSKADSAGTLLTAKTLPIEDVSPGQYRLSIQVEDPDSKLLSTTAIPFTVASELPPPPIVVARGQADTPQRQALVQYERALCFLSQNQPSEAIEDLRSSWELNQSSTVKNLLDRLSAINAAGRAESTSR